MLIKVSVHCFVLYFALGIAYSEICNLPDGGMGKCVSINQCPRLVDLVRRNRRDPKVLTYIRSIQCGTQRNVCCSDCYTPEGKSGTCVPIQECPNLLNLMPTNINYVRNSMCMSGGTDVCCGPTPVPTTRGRCESQLTAFPPDPATTCCGVEATAAVRIIGGTSTAIDQYPWLVLLEYKRGNRLATLCGGSLISNKYVVTAAHCVADKSKPVSVRVGELDTENTGEDCMSAPAGGLDCNLPAISVPVKRIVKHPEYNTTFQRNDIALIELAEAVKYTDFVRPICLPTEDISVSNPTAEVYVAGWGQISEAMTRSRFKQHVKIPLVDTQVCQNNYYNKRFQLKSNRIPLLWTRQLCAGGEAGKDSCKGDSGGPLMFESSVDGDKTITLDGLTSFGPNRCGTEGLAGVYTKIFDYNTWIRRNIEP